MGGGASTPVLNKAEPKNGVDTSNKAKGTILDSSPFDDIGSSNIFGDDKVDENQDKQVASATKLKRMAFGQQTYMDQQRDYDQTLHKLDLNKTGVVDWIEPISINSPEKSNPAKLPTTPSSIKPGRSANSSFHSPLDAKASFTTPDGTKRPLNRKPPPPARPNNVLPGQNPTQQVIQAPIHTPVRLMQAPPPSIALPISPQAGIHLDHAHSSHSASFSSQSQHRPMQGKHDHNSSGSHLLPHNGGQSGHHHAIAGAHAIGPPPGLISRPFPTQQLNHTQSDLDDGMIADFARSSKLEYPKKPDFVPALSLSIALGADTPSRPQPRTAPHLSAAGSSEINSKPVTGLISASAPIVMGHTPIQQQPPRQISNTLGGAVGPIRVPNIGVHPTSAPASTVSSPMVMALPGRPGPGQLKQATPPSSAGAGPVGGKRAAPAPVPHGTALMSAPVVKETKNVKRNRAQIPTQLKHALPTTGDWMNKRYIVNNYILLEVLGTGSYGEVRLCKDRTTDKLFAIKIFSKDFLKKKKAGKSDETFFEDIKREIAIMKKLLHPNVLRLFEVLDDPKVNKMYLVLEYMKMGDLINVLKSRGADATTNTVTTPSASADGSSSSTAGTFTPLTDLEVWNIFRQVVSGIRYLHYQNVVHGDIKPQNLLLGEDGLVKIADFGISQMLSASGQKLADAAGTPAFMSPELCEGKSFSGQLADIWAIGATMFMLRFGHPPFLAKSIINLYNKICNDPLVFPGPIDPGLRNLLEYLLEKDPTKRYTLQQIIMHPWFRHPPCVQSQFRAAATATSATQQPLSVGGSGSDSGTASPSKNGMAGMSTTHTFKPPDSYEAEEEAAMKVPVKIEHNDEVFMSIGGIQKIEKKASPARDKKIDEEGKNESEGNSENEGEENMMNTDWGADVFQMIDDGDTSDKDGYDDDSVDESDEENNKSEGEDHTGKSSKESKFNSGNSLMNTRTEMTAEEGEKRAKRFQAKILKKSNENMLLTQDKIQNEISSQDSSQASVMSPLRKVNLSRSSPTAILGEVLPDKSSLDTTSTSTSKFQRLPIKTTSTKSSRLRDGSSIRYTASRDEYDDNDIIADELSMEDFSKIMDTLAMQPKKTFSNEDEEQHSINGGLLPINGFSAELINKNNGIAASYNSEKGCRPTQEDRCLLLPNLSDMKGIEIYNFNNTQLDILKQLSIGCIFDGHSGWRCAQYLTQHFVSNLLKHEKFLEKSCETALLDVCTSIDAQVCDMLMDEEDSSGSTGVIMVYDGRRGILTVAGVGDSMCILSRSGKAVILNRMHRLDNEEERERVKRAGGTIINNRVNGLLAISRAFGDTQFKPERDEDSNAISNSNNNSSSNKKNTSSVPADGLVIATPEIISEVITPKTEFAIMATDGLWDVMTPQIAVNYIRNILYKHRDLEEAAKKLTKEAIERGSVDNVTVLIMSFHFSDEGKLKHSGKY